VRGIEDARSALGRLRRALGPEPLDLQGPLDQPSVDAFTRAMDADFNTPEALAVLFELARRINTLRATPSANGAGNTPLPAGEPPAGSSSSSSSAAAEIASLRRTLVHLLEVLGVDLREAPAPQPASVGPFVELLLQTRKKLRDIKQWGLADEIRNRLAGLGVTVEDVPGGESVWRIER
jgi:cysteinyl-tRNA synthetase